jgi:hypothetical protein
MPSPISELSLKEPTAVSQETPTEASNRRPLSESLDENGDFCPLGFKEQCLIVWDGFKRGVRYDGCTGVPDFNFGADCCGEHDYYYQLSNISRADADRKLRECIQRKGYVVLPWIFWLGVRIFGWRYYRKKQHEIFPLADDVDGPDWLR